MYTMNVRDIDINTTPKTAARLCATRMAKKNPT